MFGLASRKGSIAPSANTDLVLWDPKKDITITNSVV
ncbi:MAG: hypothetical protein EXR01_07455 [Acetobacteraceae bacterium]|nr:hypothetical protein [Acetobacteraceae bacterium]MSP30779.1 hypothetical protein [Acetobacteraceae bacterium]